MSSTLAACATATGPPSASGDTMKYMGSKARHSRAIIAAMAVRPDEIYVEPFVGGANLIADVPAADRRAADIDEDLICLWQAVSAGWTPPEQFTEDEYRTIRVASVSPLRGYAAFALSYGGKKFGGWRRDGQGVRDYVAEARRNALVQFPKLRGVRFDLGDYESLDIPDKAVVYCDPPYAAGAFDSDKFWNWTRKLSTRCRVFVSEYTAPVDFIPVWQTTVANSLTRNTGASRAVEKLWVLAPEWD